LKGPIQSVEITWLIHATEDRQKVEEALAEFLAIDSEPAVDRLEGHFGNEILNLKIHLIGEEAMAAFQEIVARLPDGLKKELVANMGAFLDEHSALFLRLDKQLLVAGTLAFGSRDSVRLKVKPRLFLLKGKAAQFYAGMIGGS
jgi:RNA binding exosome subunit